MANLFFKESTIGEAIPMASKVLQARKALDKQEEMKKKFPQAKPLPVNVGEILNPKPPKVQFGPVKKEEAAPSRTPSLTLPKVEKTEPKKLPDLDLTQKVRPFPARYTAVPLASALMTGGATPQKADPQTVDFFSVGRKYEPLTADEQTELLDIQDKIRNTGTRVAEKDREMDLAREIVKSGDLSNLTASQRAYYAKYSNNFEQDFNANLAIMSENDDLSLRERDLLGKQSLAKIAKKIEALENVSSLADFEARSAQGMSKVNEIIDGLYAIIEQRSGGGVRRSNGRMHATTPTTILPNEYDKRLYLTDSEKKVWAYYLATDEQKAEDYIKSLDRALNFRRSAHYDAEAEKYYADNKGAGVIASVASPIAKIGAAYETVKQNISNAITNEWLPVDVNKNTFIGVRMDRAARSGVTKDMSAGGSFVTNALLSAGQNLSLLPIASIPYVGQAAYSGIMGASAMGDAAYDATMRGASADEALAFGFGVGAIETVTEKIGVDNLFKIAKNSSKAAFTQSFKTSLWQGAKTMGGAMRAGAMSEGTEELVSQVASITYDRMVMGDRSEYDSLVRELESEGKTHQQAEKIAFAELYVKGSAQAFAGGVISGGLFGGATSGYNVVRTGGTVYQTGKTANQYTNANALKQAADAIAPFIGENEAVTAVQNGDASAWRSGQLTLAVNENLDTIVNGITEGTTSPTALKLAEMIKSAAQKGNAIQPVAIARLSDMVQGKGYKEADALFEIGEQDDLKYSIKRTRGVSLDKQIDAYLGKFGQHLRRDDCIFVSESVDYFPEEFGLGNKLFFMRQKNVTKSMRRKKEQSSRSAHGIDETTMKGLANFLRDPALVIVGKGRVSVLVDLAYGTNAKSDVMLIGINPNSIVDDEQGNEIMTIYRPWDMRSLVETQAQGSQIYAGNKNKAEALLRDVGLQLSEPVAYASNLTNGILAQKSSVVNTSAEKIRLTNTWESGVKNGVSLDVIMSTERLSNATGREMVFFSEAASNGAIREGFYNPADGRIYLNALSQNPMAQAIAHELTHSTELAPTYQQLRDMIMGRIAPDQQTREQLIQEKRTFYAEHGVELNEVEAEQELVAEYIAKHLLTDEKSILNLTKQNNRCANGVLNWVDKILGKLDNDATSERAFLRGVRKLYITALQQSEGLTANQPMRYSVNGEEALSIKEQLVANQERLNAMEPVADVQGEGFAGKTNQQKVQSIVEVLKRTGYRVQRENFGEIIFDEKRLKESLKYDYTDAQAIAYMAIPHVLKRGIEISNRDNHKGRGYGTITFAAPITINGKIANMAVVVKQTNGNYYKLHRVLAPDGSPLQFSIKENAEPTYGGGVTENGSLATPISSAFNTSIAENGQNVNVKNLLSPVDNRPQQGKGPKKLQLPFVKSMQWEQANASDPHELEVVKELLQDEELPFTGVDYSFAESVLPNMNGRLFKTLAQNLDNAAGSNRTLRQKLYDVFERPLYQAKDSYSREVVKRVNDFGAKMRELGIQKGSKESAAVQWYGEGQRQVEYEGSVQTQAYTLEHLKEEFPDNWKKIVEASRVCRAIYDDFADRLDRSLRDIYPDYEQKVRAEKDRLDRTVKLWGEKVRALTKSEVEITRDLADKRTILERTSPSTKKWQALSKTIATLEHKLEETRLDKESLFETQQEFAKKANALAEDIESGEIFTGKRLHRRTNYFHHFQEMEQGLGAIANIISTPSEISSHLSGLSEFTQPKTRFAGFLQQRKKGRYTEDAVAGMLKYIPLAEYKVAFDPIIAQGRTHIKGMADATRNTRNANQLIQWYTHFINDIAGKTNMMDRFLDNNNSRKAIQGLRWLNSRVRSNAVMGNARSMVAQFFNLPNAMFFIKNPKDWASGAKLVTDSILKVGKNYKTAKSIFDQSGFLRERYMDDVYTQFSDKLSEKVRDFAASAMSFGDSVVAKYIWASAYMQGARQGIATDRLAEYADDITRRSVAGRGVGDVPLAENAETMKLLAPFQVEVNNTYQLLKQRGFKEKDAVGLALFALASWLMNLVPQELFGDSISFDPIGAAVDAIESRSEEDSVAKTASDAARNLLGEVVSNMPMGAQVAQMLGFVNEDAEKLFGDNDPGRFGTGNVGLTTLTNPIKDWNSGKDVLAGAADSAANILLPFGGKQVVRSTTAMQDLGFLPKVTLSKSGFTILPKANASYADSGSVRFPVEQTPSNIAKGLLFGSFATKEGKAYIDNGEKPLDEKKTDTFNKLVRGDADTTQAFNAIKGLSSLDKGEEKRNLLLASGLDNDAIKTVYVDLVATDKDKLVLSGTPSNASVSKFFSDKKEVAEEALKGTLANVPMETYFAFKDVLNAPSTKTKTRQAQVKAFIKQTGLPYETKMAMWALAGYKKDSFYR